MKRPDSTRHLGRKPTSESKPLWKPPRKGREHSPHPYKRIGVDGELHDNEPTILYTLDEARAIFAEEERMGLHHALRRGNNRRHPIRSPRQGQGVTRAPRKCISGLNWVSWLSFVPPDWEEQW